MILNIAIGLAFALFCWIVFKAGLQSLRWIREIVEDNKTGKLSSTKVAFIVALILSSFVFLKLSFALLAVLTNCGGEVANIAITTSFLSFLRDFFTIYIAAFAATSLGSKAINAFSQFKSGASPPNQIPLEDDREDGHEDEEAKEEFPVAKPPIKGKK